MNQGWVKLHREILAKPIWTEATSEQKVLLVTLLILANHREKQWEWQGRPYTATLDNLSRHHPLLLISVEEIVAYRR